MITTVAKLKALDEFKDLSDADAQAKLEAVELQIRAYTNNNFQNRNMRIEAETAGGQILGSLPYFDVGDTLQISGSLVNDGLYIVTAIAAGAISVTPKVYDYGHNTVTKVIYPADVSQGAINLLVWAQGNQSKVGVQSETISRHSVTYFNQDANNQVMGYPVSLLGFLKPYIKARF